MGHGFLIRYCLEGREVYDTAYKHRTKQDWSQLLVPSSPDPLGVGGVWHVCPRGLLHGLLVELVFGERGGAQRTHSERWGDADL